MDRPKKEFVTSNGTRIIIKTYLTAREMNEIKKGIYAAVKVDMSAAAEGRASVSNVPDTFVIDQEKKLLEQAVTQISKENGTGIYTVGIVEALLDLPSAEYDEIVKEVNATISTDFRTSK